MVLSARMMFEIFEKEYAKQSEPNTDIENKSLPFGKKIREANKVKTAALILHDVGTKDERKDLVEKFKEGGIDILFVFNMLLTGFDAKRLKKLYLGRVIKSHNLLQALTRVNRPYKEFRYGYVVDFADISKEFDATNKAYFDELQLELGDEIQHYDNLFKSREEIEEDIDSIKDVIFHYDTNNAEIFSQQISKITDREKVREIKRVLGNAKCLRNIIRYEGHDDLLDITDFNKLKILYWEVSNHLDRLNLKENIDNNIESVNILNVALEDVYFRFIKISEEELILADKLKNTLHATREAMANNFDQNDPEFIPLKEELIRLFKKKKLIEISQEDMKKNIGNLRKIHKKVLEINRQNNLLKNKYQNDPKYTRIHKRLVERGYISQKERMIFNALIDIKKTADDQVLQNINLLKNESYFNSMMVRMVIEHFQNKNITLNAESSKYINKLIVKEYLDEFNGRLTW